MKRGRLGVPFFMAIRNPLLKAIPIVATGSDPDVECRVELAKRSEALPARFDSDAKSNHHVRPVFDRSRYSDETVSKLESNVRSQKK